MTPPKSETRGASPGNPAEPPAGASALGIKLCGELSDMRRAHSTLQADEGTRIATTHTPREALSLSVMAPTSGNKVTWIWGVLFSVFHLHFLA